MTDNNSPTPPRPLPVEGSGAQPMRYASFQHRLGAIALDSVLLVVTFGIGWAVWSLILWNEGQTPAKKILKLRTYSFESGTVATWGHMSVREFLIPLAVSIPTSIPYIGLALSIAYVVVEIVFYFTKGQRTFTDHWAKTAIINEA
jgi:uncharacterized RDD family membrane protein YckC